MPRKADEQERRTKEGRGSRSRGRRPGGKRSSDRGKRGKGRRPRGAKPDKKGGEGESDRAFDRYELEVGIPRITGVEKEEKEKEEKMKKERRRGTDKALLSMDPKAAARFNRLENEVSKLSDKIAGYQENFNSLEGDLQEIKEEYSRLEIVIRELEEMRDSYGKVDKTMRELSALYDLISAQINPFIGMEGSPGLEGDTRWDGIEDNVELMRRRLGGEEGVEREMFGEGTGEFVTKDEDAYSDEASPKGGFDEHFEYESHILEWLQFLLKRMRAEDIPNLLKYYREIGWINEDIEITVLNLLTGSKVDEGIELREVEGEYVSEDGTVIGSEEGWKLSMEEHGKSLEHIQDIRKAYVP